MARPRKLSFQEKAAEWALAREGPCKCIELEPISKLCITLNLMIMCTKIDGCAFSSDAFRKIADEILNKLVLSGIPKGDPRATRFWELGERACYISRLRGAIGQ